MIHFSHNYWRSGMVVLAFWLLPGWVSQTGAQQSPTPVLLPSPEKEVFLADISWSANGKQIAFSEYSGGMPFKPDKWAIFTVKADGSGRRLLVENAVNPAWSPDGKKLVFGSRREGNWDIYLIDAEGNHQMKLTNDQAADWQPAWSPKGDKIVFCSERNGSNNLYLMNADGSGVYRLTNHADRDFNPGWSPDGRWIVFYREKGDKKDQVWVVSADGKQEIPVTRDEAHNIYPGFLPNGRIGYSTTVKDRKNILMSIDMDGKNRTEMTGIPTFYARWSPTGKNIAFLGGAWPKSAIYLAKPDGSGIRKIVN